MKSGVRVLQVPLLCGNGVDESRNGETKRWKYLEHLERLKEEACTLAEARGEGGGGEGGGPCDQQQRTNTDPEERE